MRLKALLAVAAVGAAAACGTDDPQGGLEPTGPFGRVRFVNAVPDTVAVGRMNARFAAAPLVPFTAGLAYATATPYNPVLTGAQTLQVRRTVDTAAVVFDAPLDVGTGAYSVYATGRAGSVTPLVLTDTITIGATDSARVRVVNVSPSSPNVDVYVTTTTASIATIAPTVPSLAYRSASRYLNVPNGRVRVRVTAPGSKVVTADDSSATVASGQIRTFLVLDRRTGGTPPLLVALTDR